MSYPILYDGHDLTSLFVVEYHIERSLPQWTPNVIEAPASIGALFGGTQTQPVDISMELYTFDKTRDERQEALRTLAGWLAVDSPRVLQLGDEGGRYRMAVPTGNAPIEVFLNAEMVQISFTCPDPRLYGKERTVTVPQSGSVSLVVGGTAPSMPVVSTTVSAGATGQQWTLTLEDGSYLLYEPAYDGTASTDAVRFDCAQRVMTVNGDTEMLPPLADWLVLTTGTHTLTMGGAAVGGPATVTWREMWW